MRHARRRPVPRRKSFRQIVTDAAFRSTAVAIIAGVGYWSAVQWVDALTTTYSRTIVTDTHYITFTE